MNISKDSWHYKFNVWVHSSRHEVECADTLCLYFWLTVGSMLRILMASTLLISISGMTGACILEGNPYELDGVLFALASVLSGALLITLKITILIALAYVYHNLKDNSTSSQGSIGFWDRIKNAFSALTTKAEGLSFAEATGSEGEASEMKNETNEIDTPRETKETNVTEEIEVTEESPLLFNGGQSSVPSDVGQAEEEKLLKLLGG